METPQPVNKQSKDAPSADQFPALRAAGLGNQELILLARQGYIERDRRLEGDSGYWRLRFRMSGRLRTVYLGTDEAVVALVRAELMQLRAARRRRLAVTRRTRDGQRALKMAKQQLAPVLVMLGLHYHGDVLRKVRSIHKSQKTNLSMEDVK